MPEYGKDSQWLEPDPEGVAADRTTHFIAKNGSNQWGIESDPRDADAFIAQDGSNRWGVDTDASSGSLIVKVGGRSGFKS